MFGWFGRKDSAAEIKKLGAKAIARFEHRSERGEALARLAQIETPEATRALLGRFTVLVDPLTVDEEEKTYVLDVVVDRGDVAVAPVRDFILQDVHPTWAIRALEKLCTEAEVTGVILEALEKEGAGYTRDSEKKITLLRHLELRRDPRIPLAVAPFVADPSEDVKIAAISALSAQDVHPAGTDALLQAMQDARTERSARLAQAAATALLKLQAPVPAEAEGLIPHGFERRDDGILRSEA